MIYVIIAGLIYLLFITHKKETNTKTRLIGLCVIFLLSFTFYMLFPTKISHEGIFIVGGIISILTYREILFWLRQKATQPSHTQTPLDNTHKNQAPFPSASFSPFSKEELERYQRHIMVKEIGGQGQMALKSARILVVGAGGLGAPVLLYLGGAGVGIIGIIDDDIVALSNLQRQVIHNTKRLAESKVSSAEATLHALNPHIETQLYQRRLDAETAANLFADYDLILECSDNFKTRAISAKAAFAAEKPLIVGAIGQWDGEVSFYHPAKGTPCYLCATRHPPDNETEQSCTQAGVVGPLVGVIGSMMGLEAIKYITKAGALLEGRLMLFDGLHARMHIFALSKRPDCPLCAENSLK